MNGLNILPNDIYQKAMDNIFQFYKESKLNRNIIELRNSVVSAQIIVNAALHNRKSIGCHYIKDE